MGTPEGATCHTSAKTHCLEHEQATVVYGILQSVMGTQDPFLKNSRLLTKS